MFSIYPGATTIAEESTSWPEFPGPPILEAWFRFKWNMGWMHDTLQYFEVDPFPPLPQNDLTFGLLYAWHENFLLPLSHDEVCTASARCSTRCRGPLVPARQPARPVRLDVAHPGKKLLFMGGSWLRNGSGPTSGHWTGGCWTNGPTRPAAHMVSELNKLTGPAGPVGEGLQPLGFRWIDASDSDHNVFSFYRSRRHLSNGQADQASVPERPVAPGSDIVVCLANLSPVPDQVPVGLPRPGAG